MAGCDHAQTLTGFSAALQADVIIALRCNQWSCRWCADQKIKKLAVQTREAKPNRLLTLTVDPKLWSSPREAFDGTRRKVPDLIKALREKFGAVEYLRVTELTKAGWPHYHLLIRSGFLPHTVIKSLWSTMTGAQIVDVRQVQQSWSAYKYLVKYLSKLHKIEWTERHVSYSKGFFNAETEYQPKSLELQAAAMTNQHPVAYLLDHYAGRSIQQVSPTVWQFTDLDLHPTGF